MPYNPVAIDPIRVTPPETKPAAFINPGINLIIASKDLLLSGLNMYTIITIYSVNI
jgi:hypothetical protein